MKPTPEQLMADAERTANLLIDRYGLNGALQVAEQERLSAGTRFGVGSAARWARVKTHLYRKGAC